MIVEAGDKAKALKEALGEKLFTENTRAYESTRALMIVVTVCCLLFGIVMAVVIGRTFSVPLGLAVAAMQRMAERDLTANLDIDTKDEVGRMAAALNEALETLRSAMEQVSEGAVASSSSSTASRAS